MSEQELLALWESKFRSWIGAEQFIAISEAVQDAVLLKAIQTLHQDPYSLTKSECIDELRLLRQNPET